MYITWVFQYNLRAELIKVIKFDNKVNESNIDHNEINEITKVADRGLRLADVYIGSR